MNDLVILQKDDVFTTSDIIADGTGNNYRSIQRLIEKYENDFYEFGRVRFEITPFETKGGIQNKKIYYLNEEQATLLMTYLKNTEPVRNFKKALVREFFEMRKFIMEKHSAEWIATRYQSKLTRKAETDVIKQLVEYAKNQGSKNSEKLYMTYSRLANKVAGIESRENATINQLNNLTLIENIMLNCIRNGMAQGKGYKEIYQMCKARLMTFSDLAYLETA